MKKIVLSIIIPVYNVSTYLKECLDNVLKSKSLNYEVVLVDDGSTDDSPVLCDMYEKKYAQVRTFHKKMEDYLLQEILEKVYLMENGLHLLIVMM